MISLLSDWRIHLIWMVAVTVGVIAHDRDIYRQCQKSGEAGLIWHIKCNP